MPFSHTVEDRVVHVAWHGLVSREDLQAFGKAMPQLVASLGFIPDVLHTFEAVDGYGFQPITVYMFSLLRKRVHIPKPVRSAVVATTPETRSLAKVFKALNRTKNLEMEIFDSEVAARRWLSRE